MYNNKEYKNYYYKKHNDIYKFLNINNDGKLIYEYIFNKINDINKNKYIDDFYIHFTVYKDNIVNINFIIIYKNLICLEIIYIKNKDDIDDYINNILYTTNNNILNNSIKNVNIINSIKYKLYLYLNNDLIFHNNYININSHNTNIDIFGYGLFNNSKNYTYEFKYDNNYNLDFNYNNINEDDNNNNDNNNNINDNDNNNNNDNDNYYNDNNNNNDNDNNYNNYNDNNNEINYDSDMMDYEYC
jgi:hypothetical protein